MLDKNTIHMFLDKSDLPPKLRNLPAHQSDAFRLALLEKYGGIWMDSSIILTKPMLQQWDNDYDVGGYFIGGFTTDPDHPVFENWFISAPHGSPLIKEWKREFYFALSFQNNESYINHITAQEGIDIQNISMPSYLMCHCCFLKITRGKHNYRIKVKRAEDGPFAYLTDNKWNSNDAVRILTRTNKFSGMLKLRGGERGYMDHALLHRETIKPSSTIGMLLRDTKY